MVVDQNANGSIVNLGLWYLLYMGLLAVFCTNAINIYAGINGLEVGQSYVIGCSVLLHNLFEIQSNGESKDNHLFSAMLMLSFAGVTFAVVGILGHFSKTLLLFFIPQVINFIWSIPQLFKLAPCPRHRLPRFNAKTGLMEPSTFTCKPHEFILLKRKRDDTEVANMTVINLVLQICGPMSERSLCVLLLGIQVLSSAFALFFRYRVAQIFFDE